VFNNFKFLFKGVTDDLNRLDMSNVSSSDDIHEIIQSCRKVSSELRGFLSDHVYEYVSLGQNCNSSWYLKQLGLKTESYPFDWVFSSSEIVCDCIQDGFEKYLDKSLIEPKKGSESASHLYYHANMFNHKNPLKDKESYGYYSRCCERFSVLIESHRHIVFLITLVNEPSKRVDWAKGFCQNFSLPIKQTIETVDKLIKEITLLNGNSKFIIVDQHTEGKRAVNFEVVNDNVYFIDFSACESNTGVYFTNPLDDFCYKLILSGLYR